ncbi:MAG: carbonate dehydratase [Solirubrobacterales bacterium]|nr:carbonate dehydratase [Solirubrobacterales bacterium]
MRTTALLVAVGVAATSLTAGAALAQEDRPERLVRVGDPVRVDVNGSFVSPLVERFGDVRVGRGVFIAGNTILRADPRRRVCVGSRTNAQDNILILGLRDRPGRRIGCARRGAEIGQRTSVAHQATIINSSIGDFTFIGFRARVENSVIEDGAFVLHATTIRGVRIPGDRLVPVGATITTQAQADALPRKGDPQAEFQREVLEVNAEFSEGYRELYQDRGYDAVIGVSRAPRTEFNTGRAPRIGPGLDREPFARIVGDVRLGRNAEVGRRTSIRADEGSPIIVGNDAEIEDRVTFHALKGTSIRIGDDLDTDDNVVFHGPLVVGDRLTIEDEAILFRAVLGNGVTVETGGVVIGGADDPIEVRDGARVPAGTIVTTQRQADALPSGPAPGPVG